jgi:hypothetical protein
VQVAGRKILSGAGIGSHTTGTGQASDTARKIRGVYIAIAVDVANDRGGSDHVE